MLSKSGLYCGDIQWGSKLLKLNDTGAVLHYNSFICLIDGYDSANPTVYFATKVKKRTLKKLNKLLSKDKQKYYEYIFRDFYKGNMCGKIKWLQLNGMDSKAIYDGIRNGDYNYINDLFNQSDMIANGFNVPMNEKKCVGHLRLVK